MKKLRKKTNASSTSPPDFSESPAVDKSAESDTKAPKKKRSRNHPIIPKHRRPIICPPDRASKSLVFRLLGYICRNAVVAVSVSGLMIFITSALMLEVPSLDIFAVATLTVALVSCAMFNRIGLMASSALSIFILAFNIIKSSSFFSDIFNGFLAVYNGALARLSSAGYLTYITYQVEIDSSSYAEALVKHGILTITAIFGIIFSLSLSKKVHIIPPTAICSLSIVVILTFNIYTNRIESNLGIALLIPSLAALIVLAKYDGLYNKKIADSEASDTELSLFGTDDRPNIPPEYFTTIEGKSKTEKKKLFFKASPDGTDGETDRDRAIKKNLRELHSYEQKVAQSASAMGGFASFAALALTLLTIAFPALTISGNFDTIDAIDDKLGYVREYVTAVLRGDSDKLDELEYRANRENFEPHSTALEQLEFDGTQMFYVESRYNTNTYMRGWVGTNYKDGAWLAVDDETYAKWKEKFSTEENPAEENRYNFYHFMKPELIYPPDSDFDYTEKYEANREYGFVNLLFSIRKMNERSSEAYLASYFDAARGIYNYGTTEKSELSYVNYFDGIITGRNFKNEGVTYSTVSYVPIMTQKDWAKNQAELIASFNIQKEALLASSEEGTNRMTVTLNEIDGGLTRVTYTYKKSTEERSWSFIHPTKCITKGEDSILISSDMGDLDITLEYRKIKKVSFTSRNDDSLMSQYANIMTGEEKALLWDYLDNDFDYSDFVYSTYTTPSGSAYITELAKSIKDQAHVEEASREVAEEIPDDPETEEDESFTDYRYVTVDVKADVSKAALRNSSLTDTYIQRDILVRNVIDYIINEMGCEYTITPSLDNNDPALDGVENFLRNVKEGYCVQFASSAALILRELGIPVRYVEGYLSSDFYSKRDTFSYYKYVHDYEAHAWIEVYFDGVGWIQYETTPKYYEGLYGANESTGGTPSIRPSLPVTPPDRSEETDAPETEEIYTETEETVDTESADRLMRTTVIAFIILVAIAAILAVVMRIRGMAKAAADRRDEMIEAILSPEFNDKTAESRRRDLALMLLDSIYSILDVLDLSPKVGEFKDEYAIRLAHELGDIFTPSEAKNGQEESDIDNNADATASSEALLMTIKRIEILLDAMAREEFRNGTDAYSMKELAKFYRLLTRKVKKQIPYIQRFKLRYFKRLI